MPLIFLDTPQIDVLERARQTDPYGYRFFLDTWKRKGCTLVFTLTQQSELRRYADASRRTGRYQVLTDLAPIRSDVQFEFKSLEPRTLVHREIVGQVLARGLKTENGPSSEKLAEWANVLPGHLNAEEAGLLSLVEGDSLLAIFNMQYDATKHAAMADGDSGAKIGRRVRDLPSRPLSSEELLDYQTQMERAFGSMQEQARLGKLPLPNGQAMDWALNLARVFISRAVEIGPQAALREFLPVVGTEGGKGTNLTTDELVALSCFQLQVRFVAQTFLNASHKETELLMQTLELAGCPGFWLEHELRLRVRRARGKPRPNHHFDAERLAYLPHVDLLVTDREMTELVRQVRREKSAPERVRAARAPVAVPSSLNEIEKALDRLDLKTSL